MRLICKLCIDMKMCNCEKMLLQDPATPRASPAHSPPENGIDKPRPTKKDTPNSPASVASSGSTPSSKAKELSHVRHQESYQQTRTERALNENCRESKRICANKSRTVSAVD